MTRSRTLETGDATIWIVHATIVALVLATSCAEDVISDNDSSTSKTLESACKNKLDFKTIAEFREFARTLKTLNDSKGLEKRSSHLSKCLEERESIEELDKLIENYDKLRPCKFSEVNKLEDFAKRYLLENKKALVARFFTLFGVNVGLNCKLNLLAHVKQADEEAEQLDFIYSMASPTGWNVLINEYTKKTMKFGTSGHADSHVINRIAKLVPGLSLVDQLDYLDFHHVMNDNKQTDWKGIERGWHDLKNVALRSKLIGSLDKIIESCQNLDKFYVNSLLSLGLLRELGLVVEFLNDIHEHSVMLHKWLAAASFCQLMTRVRLLKDEKDGNKIHFEVIHDDELLDSRKKLYSYVAKFEEIDDRAREMVWQASLSDGSWRQKSEAMWVEGNKGLSVAMKQLTQFVRGVEHGFQEELLEKLNSEI